MVLMQSNDDVINLLKLYIDYFLDLSCIEFYSKSNTL
jgi:hypothetical protein